MLHWRQVHINSEMQVASATVTIIFRYSADGTRIYKERTQESDKQPQAKGSYLGGGGRWR